MPTAYDPPQRGNRTQSDDRTPPETSTVMPGREGDYAAWRKRNKVTDADSPDSHYDYRGAFNAGINRSDNGHFPDTYKQHGHPTFSEESQYSKGPGDGGTWRGETFVPSRKRRKP